MIKSFYRSWFFFACIWAFVGFALGTFILLVPIRAWVAYTRNNHLGEVAENTGVFMMIFFLIGASLYVSLKLYRWHLKRVETKTVVLALGLPFILFVLAMSLWMTPGMVNRASINEEVSTGFTIGAYPNEEAVQLLKAQGYTAIISLLHPAVVPFEPSLLADEARAAQKYGIDLIKAPMLPWVSDNNTSLKIIEDLARAGKGKYYVHCYLGKDRVNLVKNVISKVSGETAVKIETKTRARSFEDMKAFERGAIYKLDQDVYMTPYPTDEEFLAFFLAGNVQTVVNLMDSTKADNISWIDGEKRELKRAFIPFKNFTVNSDTKDEAVAAIIDSVLTLRRPIVIHHWNTSVPESKLFRRLYRRTTGKAVINLSNNQSEDD